MIRTAAAKKSQDGKRAQGVLENRLQQLDENLKLTTEQKQKIKDIWAKEARGAKGAKDATPEARRAALKSAHDQVRALLTPEQQAKFDSMPAEGRPGKGKAKGKKAE